MNLSKTITDFRVKRLDRLIEKNQKKANSYGVMLRTCPTDDHGVQFDITLSTWVYHRAMNKVEKYQQKREQLIKNGTSN